MEMYCYEEDQILKNLVSENRKEPSLFKMIFELKKNLPSSVILGELRNLERGIVTKYSYNVLNALGYGQVSKTKYDRKFAVDNRMPLANSKKPFYTSAKLFTEENGVSMIHSISCEYLPINYIREIKKLIQIQVA